MDTKVTVFSSAIEKEVVIRAIGESGRLQGKKVSSNVLFRAKCEAVHL